MELGAWELGGTPLAPPLTYQVTPGKSLVSPFGAAHLENEDRPIGSYSGTIMAPKDVPCSDPGTCEYGTSPGPLDFGEVILDYSWAQCNHKGP